MFERCLDTILRLPNLEYLDFDFSSTTWIPSLNEVPALRSLRSERITLHWLSQLTLRCANLQRVEIHGISPIYGARSGSLVATLASCRNLEEVKLDLTTYQEFPNVDTVDDLKAFVLGTRKLRELDIRQRYLIHSGHMNGHSLHTDTIAAK